MIIPFTFFKIFEVPRNSINAASSGTESGASEFSRNKILSLKVSVSGKTVLLRNRLSTSIQPPNSSPVAVPWPLMTS
ncbi:hypothetical protein QVA73_03345 [Staphylococcus chromogenes]|nr:hypothetical protein [Staphylococcus chromogenes]MDU0475928.1 hypothetical protein [Staphylococcus chromogenes]